MSRRARVLLTIAGLLAIVLIVLGYLALTHHQKISQASSAYKSAPPVVPYTAKHTYTYKNLDSYSLKTVHPGSNLTFTKPIELKPFGQASGGPSDQVLLIHSPSDHTNPDYSRIAAAVSYSDEAFTPEILSTANEATKPGSPAYQKLESTEQNFITPRLPYGFDKLSLTESKAFSSVNITANAWLSSFTATSSKLKNAPDIKGELLVAYGKQAIYYLMIDNVSSDWQVNQPIWQKVITSLKIDQ